MLTPLERLQLGFLSVGISVLLCVGVHAEEPVQLPQIEGSLRQVAADPDLGELTSARQQPVDIGRRMQSLVEADWVEADRQYASDGPERNIALNKPADQKRVSRHSAPRNGRKGSGGSTCGWRLPARPYKGGRPARA